MNLVISQVPEKPDTYDVWINSTHLRLTADELVALHNAVRAALRS